MIMLRNMHRHTRTAKAQLRLWQPEEVNKHEHSTQGILIPRTRETKCRASGEQVTGMLSAYLLLLGSRHRRSHSHRCICKFYPFMSIRYLITSQGRAFDLSGGWSRQTHPHTIAHHGRHAGHDLRCSSPGPHATEGGT